MPMMRAIVISKQGGPEVLELKDVEIPSPGSGQIRVKVVATSVNPIDYKLRAGIARYPLKLPAILGGDVSGVVDAVGHGVHDFKVGDAVFYNCNFLTGGGSYAEYQVTPTNIVVLKPDILSHEEAASIPLAGGTAWEAILLRMNVRLTETVLIHAGAGGVGSMAVQIAKAAGARVIATCRKENDAFVKTLGAWATIDYRAGDFVQAVKELTGGIGVDAAFDTVGGDTLSRSLDALKAGGRAASIVSSTGPMDKAYMKNAALHFISASQSRAKMIGLKAMLEQGTLRPVIGTVMKLTEVAEAHRSLEAGGANGKIVLTV